MWIKLGVITLPLTTNFRVGIEFRSWKRRGRKTAQNDFKSLKPANKTSPSFVPTKSEIEWVIEFATIKRSKRPPNSTIQSKLFLRKNIKHRNVSHESSSFYRNYRMYFNTFSSPSWWSRSKILFNCSPPVVSIFGVDKREEIGILSLLRNDQMQIDLILRRR